MPIVSFDFDNTLSRLDVQQYAKELIARGVEVYVLTSRYDELHKHRYKHNPTLEDLYKVTDGVGIPRNRIRFQIMRDKSEYLYGTNVLWHLDDDWLEVNQINKETKVKGISFIGGKWKDQCEELLAAHSNQHSI